MAHFHPLESSPGTCLPSPFAGRCKKGRSVRQIPRHSHTPLIPFVCPSPCSHSPFSPALPPTSVSHSRMAHGSPGTCRDGWMDATLGFSSRNPLARSCRFAFSLPSLPAAKRGCWKTENGGARWEMQGSASSPAAGAEVPLGRSAGRSRSTGEGREGSDGQGCVGRVGQMPRHAPPSNPSHSLLQHSCRDPWRAQSHCAGSELPPPPQHPPGWDPGSNREGLPIPSRMSYSGIIPVHVMSEGHEQKILQSLGIFH